MNIKQQPQIPVLLIAALDRKKQTDYSDLVTIFYAIQLGTDYWVGVVGDGGNGAYETFVWTGGDVRVSNCGYGGTEVALREVLLEEVAV